MTPVAGEARARARQISEQLAVALGQVAAPGAILGRLRPVYYVTSWGRKL